MHNAKLFVRRAERQFFFCWGFGRLIMGPCWAKTFVYILTKIEFNGRCTRGHSFGWMDITENAFFGLEIIPEHDQICPRKSCAALKEQERRFC